MRGSFFDIIPRFYILPRDRQELKQYAAAHPDQLYIQKVVIWPRSQSLYMFMPIMWYDIACGMTWHMV